MNKIKQIDIVRYIHDNYAFLLDQYELEIIDFLKYAFNNNNKMSLLLEKNLKNTNASNLINTTLFYNREDYKTVYEFTKEYTNTKKNKSDLIKISDIGKIIFTNTNNYETYEDEIKKITNNYLYSFYNKIFNKNYNGKSEELINSVLWDFDFNSILEYFSILKEEEFKFKSIFYKEIEKDIISRLKGVTNSNIKLLVNKEIYKEKLLNGLIVNNIINKELSLFIENQLDYKIKTKITIIEPNNNWFVFSIDINTEKYEIGYQPYHKLYFIYILNRIIKKENKAIFLLEKDTNYKKEDKKILKVEGFSFLNEIREINEKEIENWFSLIENKENNEIKLFSTKMKDN